MNRRTGSIGSVVAMLAAMSGVHGIPLPHRTGKPSTPLTSEQLAEWHRTHATKKKAGNPRKRKGKR